jgi:hypothetical protein
MSGLLDSEQKGLNLERALVDYPSRKVRGL